MVSYETWMSVSLSECSGSEMSQDDRQALFRTFANDWSENKDYLEGLTEREARAEVVCP